VKRYRIRLGHRRGRIQNEYVNAADARVVDGSLKLIDSDAKTVAIYRPGDWTICREVATRG
jgi:hypothetical protein